jgi:hypothetical protein
MVLQQFSNKLITNNLACRVSFLSLSLFTHLWDPHSKGHDTISPLFLSLVLPSHLDEDGGGATVLELDCARVGP